MKIRLRENDYSDITFLSYRKKDVSVGDVLVSKRKSVDKSNAFELLLEYFRKKNFPDLLPRYKCIFMFNEDDEHRSEEFVNIDEINYTVELKPITPVYRYSFYYSTEAMHIKGFWDILEKPIESFDKKTLKEFEEIANLYWNGNEYPKNNLWEYLTLKAEVTEVIDYY